MDFYKRLNYSLGNEDWHVEEQALGVAPGDHVLCVTASGDRPLHLLMTDCAKIISIDMNKIQNFLLDLKLAAISQLDFEKYLAFLGCVPTSHRLEIYKQIRPHLSPDAANHWDENKKMIARGILYQGMVERLTSIVSKFFKVLRGRDIDTLFSFTDIELQREFVAKKWDTFALRKTFDVLLNTKISKYIINDPGLNENIDSSIHQGQYIYQRMIMYLENHLACKSPLLQLFLIGKITPDAYFPYLTHDGYNKIRCNINRLQYQTGNIIDYLHNHNPNEIDCFSMSDIASYMPQAVFERLLYGMQHTAKSGARFCLREFMTKRYIPVDLQANFQRNPELEKKLEMEESNFIYRFFIGDLYKSGRDDEK